MPPEMCFTANMDDTTINETGASDFNTPPIHPLYVRMTHWINALAILIMIGSGWRIYNASPLFPFSFPGSITLGDGLAGGSGLAGALLWHFAGMWLLVANGIIYVTLGFATGRFRRKLLPIRPGE